MSLSAIFENTLLPLLSLSKFDESWKNALSGSVLGHCWQKIKALPVKAEALSKMLEQLSFVMVLLLFAALPAPQFADDKGILALLVAAAASLRMLALFLDKKDRYVPSALDCIVLAFAFMNIIATAASHYLMPSIKGLSKMLVYFSSYFLFTSVLQKSTKKRTVLLVLSLLGSAFLVSLYGIYQYKIGVAPLATWEDPNVEEKTTRVYATLKNPNLLAGYLVPLIPLSASLSILCFLQKGMRKLALIPALAVTGAIALCCIFTGSRGGYMGIAAGLGAVFVTVLLSLWQDKAKLRPLLVFLVLVMPLLLLGALHFFPSYEHRILSIFAGREHSSNSYRMNVYVSSFKMFLDSWWIGVGPGNATFKLAYGLYMRSGFDALGTYCVPLEVAVETGIGGLAVFAWLLLATLSRAHENFWRARTSTFRWLAAGAAAGLVGMMIHGLVDTVYYRPQVQFIFWLLLALCASKSAPGKDESPVAPATQEQEGKLSE